VTTTFLATPRRGRVVVAKLAACALAGATMAVLSLATSAAIAVPWIRSDGVPTDVDGDVVRVALGFVASAALHGALGVAVGALVRNQAAALTAVLVWLLAVEGILGFLSFSDLFPAAAGGRLVEVGAAQVTGGLLLAAYSVVLAVLGTAFVVRRDVT
jgi:hypothetical protein